MKSEQIDDPLVTATTHPNPELIDTLVTEFARCSPASEGLNLVHDADAIRFCRWDGQTADGKKHDQPDKPAFPWDGASDTRPMLADDIINERVALLTTSFWRAITRAKMADDEAGQYAVTLADYFVNEVLYDELAREVELSAQYREHYGWVLLHPTWEQRVALKRRKVTLEELLMFAGRLQEQGGGPGAAMDLPQLILNPEAEDAAIDHVAALYDLYAQAQLSGAVEAEVPPVSRETLRRAIRDLRKNQEAEVPVPYLCANQPAICALRPWDEVFVPPDTTDLQRGRVIFQREWVSEAELRARIREDGYNEAWVNEAVKHKGTRARVVDANLPATSVGSHIAALTHTAPKDLIEVVHAVYRAVDGDNVPAIYCTTFHQMVKPPTGKALYAKHELIDYPHGQYPYVEGKHEHWCRRLIASRGVPEIVHTWQHEEKALRDGTIDFTSIGVIPPVNVPKTPFDTKYRFGPAVQNTVQMGKEPRFMEIPNSGVPIAFAALDRLAQKVDNYFGLSSEKVPPDRAQTKQAKAVQTFLVMWSRALQQIVSLAQKYMPDSEFARVTGAPEGWLERNRDRMGIMAVELHFDVRELNEELTMKRIEAVNKTILPSDVAGTIPRAKWVQVQLRAINPTWAKELVMPVSEASEQLFNQVKNDMAQMFLGNPPQMVENDPTAQTKLQFAQQILAANPNYQQAMQQGGRFAELMQLYAKNLAFSVTQEQNKQIGRIGVNPAEVQA